MKLLIRIGPLKSFSFLGGKLHIQVYYPEFKLWTEDLYLLLDSAIRIRWATDYKAAAIAVLGFGIGATYDKNIDTPVTFDPEG